MMMSPELIDEMLRVRQEETRKAMRWARSLRRRETRMRELEGLSIAELARRVTGA
jgi:hypothetical protein